MGDSLPLSRYEALLPAYVKAMRVANIDTVERVAMFAAQLGHESSGLRYQEEIASGDAYEGRTDLGNTTPGDGRRFKGHGWIQVTGRHNHRECSEWAFREGIVPTVDYFIQHPAKLGSDEYCWVGPAWYWKIARPTLNSLSDNRDLTGVTRLINGGTNGLADRRERYNRCLALGEALLVAKGPFMGLSDKEARELLENSRYIRDQIGPKLPAWGEESSLGKNGRGQELTFRDAFARFLRDWPLKNG